MSDLEKKIDELSDSLFLELNLKPTTEESKAEIFAHIQDALHKVIFDTYEAVLKSEEKQLVKRCLEGENYNALEDVFRKYPKLEEELEQKLPLVLGQLKEIFVKEQENAV